MKPRILYWTIYKLPLSIPAPPVRLTIARVQIVPIPLPSAVNLYIRFPPHTLPDPFAHTLHVAVDSDAPAEGAWAGSHLTGRFITAVLTIKIFGAVVLMRSISAETLSRIGNLAPFHFGHQVAGARVRVEGQAHFRRAGVVLFVGEVNAGVVRVAVHPAVLAGLITGVAVRVLSYLLTYLLGYSVVEEVPSVSDEVDDHVELNSVVEVSVVG